MLVWIASAWAECTFRAGGADVSRALDAAERAYVTLDLELFEKATTEVDFVVPCLEAMLDVATAARLHRLRALGRFADGDRDGALLELTAAKVLEPTYVFPLDVLPEGFELRLLYEGVDPAAGGEVVRLPRPRAGSLVLDGSATRSRPVDRPVVFQRLEGGEVVQTQMLAASDPVPWYPGLSQRRTILAVSSLATAAVATGFYVAAVQTDARLDAAANEEDLRARARTADLLGGVGLGLYAVAGAGGVAAVVVGRP